MGQRKSVICKSMVLSACIAGFFTSQSSRSAAVDIPYRGVNLSGAESGGCSFKDPKYGFKYIYPRNVDIDFFMSQGMNTFRVPFCWERLQKSGFAEFETAEIDRIDKVISYATSKGAYILLDPHNYALYWGKPIITDEGTAMFADFWTRLAARYRDNNRVLFGLMNEPKGISSEAWLKTANQAISAIRNTGAKNLILVPGVAWTGAHSWTGGSYGTPNSVSMLQITDPANNYAYEVHQYFDKDSSGTTPECVAAEIGAKRLANLNAWLKANNKKAFMGEFGGARTDICYAATTNMLTTIHQNPDLWIGWTYWSAGPWLSGYMFGLPLKITEGEFSQLDVLKKFLQMTPDCAGIDCSRPSPPKLNIPKRQ